MLQDLSTQQKCLHTQASRLPVDILLSISELSWNLSQFIRDLICNARHDLYGDPWATVVCYLDFDCSSYGIPWIFLSGCVISGHFKMLTDLYTICEKERRKKKVLCNFYAKQCYTHDHPYCTPFYCTVRAPLSSCPVYLDRLTLLIYAEKV